jgi:exosortase A-associated hydrolase 1
MNVLHEKPVVIQGAMPTPMLGILHLPGEGVIPSGTGVVIVNGGAQYRAGAHRMFVQLARHLSEQGHAVLRFDFPGQGDSPGAAAGFEGSTEPLEAAIEELHKLRPLLRQCALLGLCDGASAVLLYLHATADARVTHICLLNPWVNEESSEARARIKHYYLRRLLMREFWGKVLKGGIGWQNVLGLLQRLSLATKRPSESTDTAFAHRMGRAWQAFQGERMVVLSECDQTAQTFKEHACQASAWRDWSTLPGVRVLYLQDADHTLSAVSAASKWMQETKDWLLSTQG